MLRPFSIDLFCHVVDNYGDIGVSWRVARQLAAHAHPVRLWVDNLVSFKALCRAIDPTLVRQRVDGVEIHRWDSQASLPEPGDVVIEMFGCEPPAAFVEAMARRAAKPLWINIEYLSAEPWVNESHGLPSPHPRLPLTRWFYFPGFRPCGGGLPAPSFVKSTQRRRGAAQVYGLAPTPADTLEVFLFAYPTAPLLALLRAWAQSPRPIRCLIPEGSNADTLLRESTRFGSLSGEQSERKSVTIEVVPFVDQTLFDEVLAGCDLAFVRGEESFAQVQWHGRPFVWQIYPQSDAAHEKKLAAFLDLYLQGLDEPSANAIRSLWTAWNGFSEAADLVRAWNAFLAHYSAIQAHAIAWAERVNSVGDLTSKLEAFIRERL